MLLRSWTAAAAAMTQGQPVGGGTPLPYDSPASDTGEALGLPPSRLTLTFGFGPSLFRDAEGRDRFGIADRSPKLLRRLPHFPADDLSADRSDGDLCVQACADDPQVAVHAIRNLSRIGFRQRGAAVVAARLRAYVVDVDVAADAAQPVRLQGRHRQPQGRAPRRHEEARVGRPRRRLGRRLARRRLLPGRPADQHGDRAVGPDVAARAGAAHRPRPRGGRSAVGRQGVHRSRTSRSRAPTGCRCSRWTRTSGSPTRRRTTEFGCCVAATTSPTAATTSAASTPGCSSSPTSATRTRQYIPMQNRLSRDDGLMEYLRAHRVGPLRRTPGRAPWRLRRRLAVHLTPAVGSVDVEAVDLERRLVVVGQHRAARSWPRARRTRRTSTRLCRRHRPSPRARSRDRSLGAEPDAGHGPAAARPWRRARPRSSAAAWASAWAVGLGCGFGLGVVRLGVRLRAAAWGGGCCGAVVRRACGRRPSGGLLSWRACAPWPSSWPSPSCAPWPRCGPADGARRRHRHRRDRRRRDREGAGLVALGERADQVDVVVRRVVAEDRGPLVARLAKVAAAVAEVARRGERRVVDVVGGRPAVAVAVATGGAPGRGDELHRPDGPVPDGVAVEAAVVGVVDGRDRAHAVQRDAHDGRARHAVVAEHRAAVAPVVGLHAADAGEQVHGRWQPGCEALILRAACL